ncbi:TadE/TadG family type IV pilus assembly protein [Paraburkholderia sp. DHOC27]|uniref:TadE/TadG family type IV pilus assembly protein n=1 Tax=Paraburkholderia sp. DHOC27 TaxID=2303330 RepID=UPI00216B46A1|nr:TadE family protein [Paraburkholderia sp. DHOC27]
MRAQGRRTSSLRQRGVAAVEFALVFPLFFVVMYGIVTFSLVFVAQQSLTLAAEEGARAALNYQQATSVSAALTARANAACSAATNMIATMVNTATCVATPTTCNYNASMDCVNVTLTYNYASNPLIPNLPLMNMAMPSALVSSAMVQLNPGNIL